MPQIKINYKTFELGDWIKTVDNGADFLKCPDCGCGIIFEWYARAVGTKGLTFCPYCGQRRIKQTKED